MTNTDEKDREFLSEAMTSRGYRFRNITGDERNTIQALCLACIAYGRTAPRDVDREILDRAAAFVKLVRNKPDYIPLSESYMLKLEADLLRASQAKGADREKLDE